MSPGVVITDRVTQDDIVLYTPVSPDQVIVRDDQDVLVVDRIGPRGPQGDPGVGEQGLQGVTGEAGPPGKPGEQGLPGELSVYRHVQLMPTRLWDVHYTVSTLYPKVNVILSDGSTAEGDVAYLAPGHLTISFSAAVSGEASIA
jgi:hypothetical protein